MIKFLCRILPVLVASAILASCSGVEEAELPSDSSLLSVSIQAEINSTKSYLGEASGTAFPVLWSDGDAIAVHDGVAVRKFTIVPGSNSGNSAVFAGEIAQGTTTLKAAFPYDLAQYENGEFVVPVPSVQTPSDHSVSEMAMVSTAESNLGSKLVFHNAVSLLRFSVPEGTSKLVLHSCNGEIMSGSNSTSVSVILPGKSGQYEVAVRPGTYAGIRAFAYCSDGTYMKQSNNVLTVTASGLKTLGDVKGSEKVTAISTLDELKNFLSNASSSSKVYMLCDIDAASSGLPSAESFSGNFDGLGHKISAIGGANALFQLNKGSICNLSLQGDQNPDQSVFAPLVIDNRGILENIENAVSITKTLASDISEPVLLAGIAAKSSGAINDCVNKSDISFSSTANVTAVGLAGIVAYATAPLTGCVNKGTLTMSFKSMSNVGTVGSISKASPSAGGIVAFAYTGFKVENCINDGGITYTVSNIELVPALSFRSQIGGIAGSPSGDIVSCTNNGSIYAVAKTADGSAFSTNNFIIGIGGISGGEYTAASQNSTNIEDCTNNGHIWFRTDASKSYTTVGGIVAWPGVESTAQTVVTSGCTNNGTLTVSGAGKVRVGGVQGGCGSIVNCANTAAISYNGTHAESAIGGLCGFHSQNLNIKGSSNTGNVSSSAACYVGGLIGNHGNAATSCLSGCTVDCTVSSASDNSIAGMVVGRFSGTSAVVTLGSESEPINVAGTLTTSTQTVELDQLNFADYLAGTVNESSNHTIYAQCDTEAPAAPTVEGYVKYSDGSPAVGVSVSDGFRVAVTDSQGYYKLETCSDCWYIYISYPSDAKITVSGGRPEFFKRYISGTSRYDFSFEKQAVESKFALFAFADPQAHYAKRSPQKSSDTDRFRNESVPAINNEIASQSLPCYGVTLGDIVYSEGGRNSNPGMSTMCTHFGKINMPVFQTMGNHDFTYFYTNKALTTDATSSTQYLKVQRNFETAFGPINYSFNRGDVHVVCMRDIIWDSDTDAASYHGGFSDAQYQWLKADLANVPSSKKVILCVHIPFVGLSGKENVSNVLTLLKKYTNSEILAGHTHYKRGVSNVLSSGLYEHIHSAVCGQWWWSRIEGDGCPNGYTVYEVDGTSFSNEYFMGVNEGMNERQTCQMRVYRGGLKYGGDYAYFQTSTSSNQLLINVFNADSRWKSVKVYEDGVLKGNASLISQKRISFSSVEKGQTYSVASTSSQDWWAIAYHIGVLGRGMSNTSYYTTNFHMYKYTMSNSSAVVKVVATDGYGNEYTCTEVIEDGTSYPDYIVGIR